MGKQHLSAKSVRGILGGQIRAMRKHARRLRWSYNEDTVHDLRVASARARFALKVFKRSFATAERRNAQEGLRQVRRVMGAARNMDIALCRTSVDLKVLDFPSSRRRVVLRAIRVPQRAARRELRRFLASGPFRQLIAVLSSLAREAEEPGISVRHQVAKRLRGLEPPPKKDAGKDLLHRVRIAFKNLRYTCEFFREERKEKGKAFKQILRFQDVLGERQDAVATVRILEGLDLDPSVRTRLIRREQGRIRACERRFQRLWRRKRMLVMKPASLL